MFCERCGAQIEEGAFFCTRCGNRVTDLPEFTETEFEEEPVPKKKKAGKMMLGTGIVMMVLAVIAGIFVVTGGPDKVNAAWQMNLGNRYLEDMDYEEAIVAFKKVIEIEPKEEDAYIGLADAYVGLGDYEEALKALQKGIKETDSDKLRDYRKEIQERWDDEERRIYGRVYAVDTDLDDTNNKGIPDARIYVTDKKGETSSFQADKEGYFDTGRLSKGTYTVRFSAEGYVEYEEQAELTGGKYELNACIEPDMRAVLYGSVLIADEDMDYSNNIPLKNADVSLEKLNGSTAFSTTGKTDENGQYVIPDLLMGVYHLKVSKTGYLTAEQTLVIYEGQDISYNTLIEAVSIGWRGRGTASGTVYDALTGEGVAGLTLKVRKGINNVNGEPLEVFETDTFGRYMTPELENGNYSIEIRDNRQSEGERYLGTVINIKVLGGLNIDNQDGTVSNTIQTGQVRIVLTWGAAPDDLDSHLECGLNGGEYYSVYFSDRTFMLSGVRIADLDLDDIDCYGPETTTIYQSDPGEYLFWVHNYSGYSEYELANSGACVQVYMGYSAVPTYVFYVPNEAGYGWEVFRYNSVSGKLTPSNRMYTDWDLVSPEYRARYGGNEWPAEEMPAE